MVSNQPKNITFEFVDKERNVITELIKAFPFLLKYSRSHSLISMNVRHVKLQMMYHFRRKHKFYN